MSYCKQDEICISHNLTEGGNILKYDLKKKTEKGGDAQIISALRGVNICKSHAPHLKCLHGKQLTIQVDVADAAFDHTRDNLSRVL